MSGAAVSERSLLKSFFHKCLLHYLENVIVLSNFARNILITFLYVFV